MCWSKYFARFILTTALWHNYHFHHHLTAEDTEVHVIDNLLNSHRGPMGTSIRVPRALWVASRRGGLVRGCWQLWRQAWAGGAAAEAGGCQLLQAALGNSAGHSFFHRAECGWFHRGWPGSLIIPEGVVGNLVSSCPGPWRWRWPHIQKLRCPFKFVMHLSLVCGPL